MGTETKGPSLVFLTHSRKCQGADEYFLNAETWGQKQKDRPLFSLVFREVSLSAALPRGVQM